MGLLLVFCSGVAVDLSDEPVVLRYMGSPASPHTTALVEAFRHAPTGRLRLAVHASDDESPTELMRAIERGKIDVTVALAHDVYFAFAGGLDGVPDQVGQLRAISVAWVAPLQLFARAGSGIRSVYDLRGRRVAVPSHASLFMEVRQILQAFSVDLAALHTVSRSAPETDRLLRESKLDAMFTSSASASRVEGLRGRAYLVPIDGPPVAGLQSTNPFLKRIPAGRYRGIRSVATVGNELLLICHRDLDERVVYEFATYVFEAFRSLPYDEAFDMIEEDQASATVIPLHKGAARYFRERELLR